MEKISKKVSKTYSWCYIKLPKYIEKKILSFGEEIDKEDLYVKEAEGGLEKDVHITVKYAILTNEVKDIRDLLKKEKGGKAHILSSSIFETEEYDVVKMTVESEDLQRLHSKINNLPHEDKYSEYIPHSTIAYVKKGCGKKYDGKFKLDKKFRFNEIYFGNQDERNFTIFLNPIKKALNDSFLRCSIFSKRIYTISAFAGEWWIINGRGTYADGDIGDMNHDAYVIDYIQRQYLNNDSFDHGEWIDWKGFEEFLLKENKEEIDNLNGTIETYLKNEFGMDDEKIQIARGGGDPKGYAVRELGWKKVNKNEISTWTLDASDMAEIARGLWDVSSDESSFGEEIFNIFVESSNIAYYDVPINIIERNTPSELIEFRRRY